LEEFGGLYDTKGRKAVVRNGYLSTREILTGLGPVQIQVPRTRDCGDTVVCQRWYRG